MAQKEYSFFKKLQFSIVGLLFFTFLLIGIGEIVTRIVSEKIPVRTHSNKADNDSLFGWVPKANFAITETQRTSADQKYTVNYTTEDYGFRAYGNPKTNKKKILFIGDSYTQAVEVETQEAFYSIIGDSLNAEIFAIGMAGYGNTQEYLLLDKYLDTINPDLVVFQHCENDFIDNNVELEMTSNYKVGLRRPYFKINGEIEYRRPIKKWRSFLEKSRFISLILRKLKYGVISKVVEPAEKLIAEQGTAFPAYAHSIDITEIALKKTKERLNGIESIIFSSSTFEPQLSDFREIATKAGFAFYDESAQKIKKIKKKEVVTSIDTYHWVAAGHKVVAEELLPRIKQHLN